MRFEHYMALRYLRAARGQTEGRGFLRFITYVAIGGVALGVGALVLSLSIVRGFSREIQDKIIGFGAHVQVENFRDAPLESAPALQRELAGFPEVRSVAPVVQDFVLLRRSTHDIDGAVIWGTDTLPSYLAQHMVAGQPFFQPDSAGHAGIVVGQDLAKLLGVSVGDVITAFSMRSRGEDRGEESTLPSRPRVAQYCISGVYETSLQNFDELYVFTGIGDARHLLDYRTDEVTRFDLTITDPRRSEGVAEAIQDSLGFPVLARSIFDVWRGIFAWVHLQQSVIPLVIAVIVIVAAFNIVGTLLMIILEKTREIGVLESMGAAPRALRHLFLRLGLLIGIIGTVVGESIALILALLQKRYAIIPLPAEAYYMKTAPIELHALDFLVVAVVAVVLCVLASYIPARLASRIDPIRSIRFR